MKTIILWYRNDLRVHDHPVLAAATEVATHVVPVFILDTALLQAEHRSSNRNRFLLECLNDLRQSLIARGSNLIIRHGAPIDELRKIVAETAADGLFYSADYTPYSQHRDAEIDAAFQTIEVRRFSGRLIVDDFNAIHTQTGTVHKVFTPFYKNWLQIDRRPVAPLPALPSLIASLDCGSLPELAEVTTESELSPQVLCGGETIARQRLTSFLATDIDDYGSTANAMASNRTSRLSPYLHFGCISPREIESLLSNTSGAQSWRRQLAWREFYYYILFHFPKTTQQPFQEKYQSLTWDANDKLLRAWQDGRTGYPIVDAAMRQLNKEGWMHNRGRLIVGSFLTKDLWLDWRLGAAYFYRMLLDGDVANNTGNWQWIASIGVDTAPVYRRLYNPASQQKNHDPDGIYTRRFVPELKNVPDKYLAEPWTMPREVQQAVGCVIGTDYPSPIVNHKLARAAALENYRI